VELGHELLRVCRGHLTRPPVGRDGKIDVISLNPSFISFQRCTVEHAAQLTYIAGPPVGNKPGETCGGQPLGANIGGHFPEQRDA
jgi:hypothetical protein